MSARKGATPREALLAVIGGSLGTFAVLGVSVLVAMVLGAYVHLLVWAFGIGWTP